MAKSTPDISILAPQPVNVTIGDRVFIQKPLSLRSTTDLLAVLQEEFNKASSAAFLTEIAAMDIDTDNPMSMLPTFLAMLNRIPDAAPRLMAVILGVKFSDRETFDEVSEYIAETASPNQALAVFRTFLEQNEPQELIANFLALRIAFSMAMEKAKETLPAS